MWNNTASHIYKLYSIVLMTRIERWAIHNNLIPDAQFGFCKYRSQYTWLYLYSENMHRCQNSRTRPVHLFVDFCKALIESVKIACGESLENLKEKKHPSTSMQQEGWRSKWPIVRPDPNKKWSETRMPIEPFTITFYFGHSQTAKRKKVHWSNTWHISNQLPTVCYQTI